MKLSLKKQRKIDVIKEGEIMQHIVVLMSTYNGEKFIKEQIESLLEQNNVLVSIVVRDDGSTDSTKEILK